MSGKRRRRAWRLVLGSSIALLASIWILRRPPPPTVLSSGGRYLRSVLPPTVYLADLGVADIDDDGWLDIYSINHQVRPLMLINRRAGAFTDEVLPLNLGTALDFGGSEPAVTDRTPALDQSGLYIYRRLGELVVRAHGVPSATAVTGTLLVRRHEVAQGTRGATLTERPIDAVSDRFPASYLTDSEKAIDFILRGDASVTVRSRLDYFGPRFAIGDSLAVGSIFVGARRTNPSSHVFALRAEDRHAMAWFDIDGDSRTDVIAARGGRRGRVRGGVEEGSGSYRVLLQRAGRLEETFPYDELSGYGCPTRQLSLADYDRDGDLDLYVVCGRTAEDEHQVFERTADGSFRESSAARGLDGRGAGLVTWLDADGDGDLDLFRAGARDAWLHRNHAGRFEAESIGALRGRPAQVTRADYDGDGDLDLYLSARTGSSLLVGERGRFTMVEPESRGLPDRAVCGNWVDYDNDGDQDLHVLPQGIFEQQADGRFAATGLLARPAVTSAFCTWLDADNDGYRDLLVATPRDRPGRVRRIYDALRAVMGRHFFVPRVWDVSLYRAVPGPAHWLEVELRGSIWNRPAIGSSVRVRADSTTQVRDVGHAEASGSSGHYRIYFGLGGATRVEALQVEWPDGTLQQVEGGAPDRLVIIERAPRSP